MTSQVEAEGVAVRSAPDGGEPTCTAGREPACKAGGPVGYAVTHVARLHRMVGGKVLRGLGLYPGQEFVMLHLWKSGPLRQSDLIKYAELDPSTVTKMLQRLEQAGHVRRRPDPADRRAVLVEATEQSCALRVAVEQSLNTLEERMLTGLDEGERAELLRLLNKAERNLCQEAADCDGAE
ncbi:MarR family winged helix-turn-helix transcriptional regulator [Streptomyces sp. NPDC048057]|uniref:MarR family winged helix-turn-helix transcriptional regulator n=1 Tax=Streptomyces sp. NPDC048057 TaxID=3155628 RepID=UPI0033E11A54